jgi:hypothetical protein
MSNSSDRVKQIREEMETLSFIMSHCYSDEAYRLHQQHYDDLVKELLNAEREERNSPGNG